MGPIFMPYRLSYRSLFITVDAVWGGCNASDFSMPGIAIIMNTSHCVRQCNYTRTCHNTSYQVIDGPSHGIATCINGAWKENNILLGFCGPGKSYITFTYFYSLPPQVKHVYVFIYDIGIYINIIQSE